MGGLKHQLENFRVVGGDAFAVKPRDTILGVNGEVSDPRVSGIRPIFVAALAAAIFPART